MSECDWMSFGNVYIICLKRVEDWERVREREREREREHKIKKEGMYKRKVCSVWKIYTYSWMELRVRVILRHRVYWTLYSNIVRLSCIYVVIILIRLFIKSLKRCFRILYLLSLIRKMSTYHILRSRNLPIFNAIITNEKKAETLLNSWTII